MYEYLVTFRGKKKLVMIDKKENFLKQIEKKFNLLDSSCLNISLFHEGFKEYVEIEITELPDSGKLLISEPPPFEFSLSFSDDMSSLSSGLEENPHDLRLTPSSQLHEGSLRVTESNSDSDTVILSSPSPSEESSPSQGLESPSLPESAPTQSSTSSTHPCLPSPLVLPSELFGSLQQRLDGKHNLSQTDRSKILDSVYDFLTGQYNMYYLTAVEYDAVVAALLEKYPHLSEGLDKGNAKALWHRCLKDKFKNTRKRYDQKIDCVAAKRRKVKTETLGSHTSATIKNEWGVQNFLPEKDPAHDDETTKNFITWLKTQDRLEISKRDVDGTNYRMDKTFPDRRNRIVVQGKFIQGLKDEYPILFSEDELPKEMRRLTGKELEKAFTDNLMKYSKKIIALPLPTKDVTKWKNLRVEVGNTQSQTQRNYREQSLALLITPGHLKEALESLFMSKDKHLDSEPIHPHIIWESDSDKIFSQEAKFYIFAENVKICETKKLTKAFFLMMCSFYIFNLEYPRKMKSTLAFLQKCLLDIHDYRKPTDVKLLNFLTKLNKLKA